VISIAANNGLYTVAGKRPIPTFRVLVAESAMAADVKAPGRKQSSQSHNSSKPADSALRAYSPRVSGGNLGWKISPIAGVLMNFALSFQC
jgi:hypothetical protein